MTNVEFVHSPDLSTYQKQLDIQRGFAQELMKNPGEWGIWPSPIGTRSKATSMKSLINRGKRKHFPAGEFEAENAPTGTTLYVRYVGDQI